MKRQIAVLFLIVVFGFGCGRNPTKATTAMATTNQPKPPLVQPRQESRSVLQESDAEFNAKMEKMQDWAKKHVSTAEERCADFKATLMASNLDSETKDLIWKAVLVSSEYCWAIDQPKAKTKK